MELVLSGPPSKMGSPCWGVLGRRLQGGCADGLNADRTTEKETLRYANGPVKLEMAPERPAGQRFDLAIRAGWRPRDACHRGGGHSPFPVLQTRFGVLRLRLGEMVAVRALEPVIENPSLVWVVQRKSQQQPQVRIVAQSTFLRDVAAYLKT